MPGDTVQEKLVRAALMRLVDVEAFEGWRSHIDVAIRKAFGDLDPQSESLADDFRARTPAFLESLPGLMDTVVADDFCDALHQTMLASFLNASLPVDFWTRRRPAK